MLPPLPPKKAASSPHQERKQVDPAPIVVGLNLITYNLFLYNNINLFLQMYTPPEEFQVIILTFVFFCYVVENILHTIKLVCCYVIIMQLFLDSAKATCEGLNGQRTEWRLTPTCKPINTCTGYTIAPFKCINTYTCGIDK